MDHDAFLAHWRGFWAAPSPEGAGRLAHPDMVMSFPGRPPVIGAEGWRDVLADLLGRFPDLRLEPTAHGHDDQGVTFISWRGTLTVDGETRTFEGIDRMRFADGKIIETFVAFDTAPFLAVLA